MKTRRDKSRQSVTTLGYFDKSMALDAIDREGNRSILEGTCGTRLDELEKVKKFVNLYGVGEILKVTLRRRSFIGAVVGFRRVKRRGWVIGVLSAKDNGIKEVTIDLMGYGDQMFGPDEYEEAEFNEDARCHRGGPEIMEDREKKYIALVTNYETILILSPAA